MISAKEFADWQRYYRLEPFGPGMHNYMVAMQTAHLFNAALRVSKDPMKPADFLPKFQ